MRSADSSGSKGVAMLELCLLLPVLFFIGSASLELVLYIRTMQIGQHIGQEAANTVYRECAGDLNSPGSAPDASDCVEKVRGEFVADLARMGYPGEITLSLYSYDINYDDEGNFFPRSVEGPDQRIIVPQCIVGPRGTKVDMSNRDQATISTEELLKKTHVAAIAEVYLPHRSLFTAIGMGPLTAGEYYDRTVL